MAGGVAVAVAGWAGRAGFSKRPHGPEAVATSVGQEFGVALGSWAKALHVGWRDPQKGCPSRRRVDNEASDVEPGRTRDGQKGGADQAACRGLANRQGRALLDQAPGDPGGDLARIIAAHGSVAGWHFVLLDWRIRRAWRCSWACRARSRRPDCAKA